jgi:two-component system, NarL family, sensor kinase
MASKPEPTERPSPRRPRRSPTRELRILNSIAEALNSAPDVQQALEQTLRLVADLLGLRTGWIWLLDPESDQFYSAAAQELPPYLQEPVRMAGVTCWCTDMFRKGKLAPANVRLIQCSRLLPAVEANDTEATAGLSCHASIPLHFQEKPLGIMNVTAPAWRELSPDELRLLATIGYQVGIAIERARLAEAGARLARAEERARIAREIHDTLAQGLTAIILHVEGAMHHLRSDPEVACRRLERALAAARENLEEARRSVLDLRAAPLAEKPLPEALRALARSFTTESGIRVQLRLSPDVPGLPLRVEAELYRIAQEALANVARHAKATSVTVELRHRRETLRLAVRNDGPGFDPRSVPNGRQGIVGMRERARLLGGRLRIRSGPGGGTTVVAEVPVGPVGEQPP